MAVTIQLNPENIAKELLDYQQKLQQGIENLKRVKQINSGVTPKQLLYQKDKVKLYRYQSTRSQALNATPVLIVYALVNRPYMADLQKGRSTIQGLLDTGQDVYLVDWGYPDWTDKLQTLDDYINGNLDKCVDFILRKHGIEQLHLLGICQGGTFSLCYSAIHPQKIRSLITMVTPIDFKTPDNMLSRWVQSVDVDLLVDTMGNIPGAMMNGTFVNLKPYQLLGQKYLGVADILSEPDQLETFLLMEKWLNDSPDLAGETFRQFLKDCFQENKLIRGDLYIGEHRVDLQQLEMPLLNVYANQDHLVPPAASKVLKDLTKSRDYSELSFNGGHIGIYVSQKAQKVIAPKMGEWLNQH